MRAAFLILSLCWLASCGETRTVNQTPDAVPKLSVEVQSLPFEHLGKTLDDLQLTAALNTVERGLDHYLLTVDWTEPADFPTFTWTIFFRYGDELKKHHWTLGNGPKVIKPLLFELSMPLPDAIEFRLLTHSDSWKTCELNPKEYCPLIKSILLH